MIVVLVGAIVGATVGFLTVTVCNLRSIELYSQAIRAIRRGERTRGHELQARGDRWRRPGDLLFGWTDKLNETRKQRKSTQDTCECDSCERVFPLREITFGAGGKSACPKCRGGRRS